MHNFIHLSIGFDYIQHYRVGAVCRQIVCSSILLGVFHRAPLLFLFFIFPSTESTSSWVNAPSLMSNCLLIILVIGSCVTFGEFPSKFLKCCFHRCISSCWLEAFSLAFAVFFLLFTLFIVCHAILDCLSSTKSYQSDFVCILSVLLGWLAGWLIVFMAYQPLKVI